MDTTRRSRRARKFNFDHEMLDYMAANAHKKDADLAEELQVSNTTFYRLKRQLAAHKAGITKEEQKKLGVTDWREYVAVAQQRQALRKKASFSQDFMRVGMKKEFGAAGPIAVVPLSDLHIGAMATDYTALLEITEGILANPNVFVILNGDLTETTATFKNALAVHSQVFDIEEQHAIVESWLQEIAPKVISAGWDNHAVERQERDIAMSPMKHLLNRLFRYHNGQGRVDLELGGEIYRLLVSHKLAGVSIFNRLHGAKRAIRLEYPEVDIVITGDYHTPAMEEYYDGQHKRLAIMAGNLKIDCGYQKRYFSLFSHAEMPCFVLHPDRHEVVPFFTLDRAIIYLNGITPTQQTEE